VAEPAFRYLGPPWEAAARADLQKADLKTFTALGCYGASVVTALTAQNTKGVQDVHTVPPQFVEHQVCIRSSPRHHRALSCQHHGDTDRPARAQLQSDIPVAAIKTGMLSTAGVVRCSANAERLSSRSSSNSNTRRARTRVPSGWTPPRTTKRHGQRWTQWEGEREGLFRRPSDDGKVGAVAILMSLGTPQRRARPPS